MKLNEVEMEVEMEVEVGEGHVENGVYLCTVWYRVGGKSLQ